MLGMLLTGYSTWTADRVQCSSKLTDVAKQMPQCMTNKTLYRLWSLSCGRHVSQFLLVGYPQEW